MRGIDQFREKRLEKFIPLFPLFSFFSFSFQCPLEELYDTTQKVWNEYVSVSPMSNDSSKSLPNFGYSTVMASNDERTTLCWISIKADVA